MTVYVGWIDSPHFLLPILDNFILACQPSEIDQGLVDLNKSTPTFTAWAYFYSTALALLDRHKQELADANDIC